MFQFIFHNHLAGVGDKEGREGQVHAPPKLASQLAAALDSELLAAHLGELLVVLSVDLFLNIAPSAAKLYNSLPCRLLPPPNHYLQNELKYLGFFLLLN